MDLVIVIGLTAVATLIAIIALIIAEDTKGKIEDYQDKHTDLDQRLTRIEDWKKDSNNILDIIQQVCRHEKTKYVEKPEHVTICGIWNAYIVKTCAICGKKLEMADLNTKRGIELQIEQATVGKNSNHEELKYLQEKLDALKEEKK